MFGATSERDLCAMQESLESSTELTQLISESPLQYSPPHLPSALSQRTARDSYKPFPPLLTLKARTPSDRTSRNQWWLNRLLGKFSCSCNIFCKDTWQPNQNTEMEVLLLSRSPSESPESMRTFNLSPTRALTSLSVEECTLLTEGIRASSIPEHTFAKTRMSHLELQGLETLSDTNPPQNMSSSIRGSPTAATPSPLLNFRRSEEYMMNLPSNSPMEIFCEEYRNSTQPDSTKELFDTESCFEREVLQMGETDPTVGENDTRNISITNNTPDFRTFLQRHRSLSSESVPNIDLNARDSSPRSIEEWPVSTAPRTTPASFEEWKGVEENYESILEDSIPELVYARTSCSLIRNIHEMITELRAGFRKLDVCRSGLVSRHDVEAACLLYDLVLFTPENRAAGLWPASGSGYPNLFQYATFLVFLSQKLRRGPLQDRVLKNWKRIDVMVIGDPGVGKSSFVARALDGRHARLSSRSSDSLEFSVIPFWRNHTPGVVRLWDIPVGPKFPALAHYYEKMNGFLLLSWLPEEQDRSRDRVVSEYYGGRADHNFLASCREWVDQLPAKVPLALFFNQRGEEEHGADKDKLASCCEELPIDNIFVGSVYTGEGVDNAFKWISEASIESISREQSSARRQSETEGSFEPSISSTSLPTLLSNNMVFSKPSNVELPLEPLSSEDFPAAKEITEAVKQVKKSRPTAPVDLAVYPTIRTPQRVRVNLHPGYSFLSVREGPSIKSRSLGKIVEGTILTVLDKSDDWIRHELGWTAQRWNDRVWLTPI